MMSSRSGSNGRHRRIYFIWVATLIFYRLSILAHALLPGFPNDLGTPRHRNLYSSPLELRGFRRFSGIGQSSQKLHAEKDSGLWQKTRKLFKKERSSYQYARTTPYLETLDKRRGYYRANLGGRVKNGKNGPEKVAEATVGRFASRAFM